MPRHNRRRADPPPRAAAGAAQRIEPWRGEDYVVRAVPGSAAVKPYRCPGCDQLVPVGRPHVVAWPLDAPDAGDRRHWHAPCWAARDTRGPGLLRSRGAPRH